MPSYDFENCVFINCPFDEDFAPILQAMMFCVVYFGLTPRLASERNDSGENRLEKIRGLIESSKYSIHDLSRCQAKHVGEHFRLNMPFELGIDFGCRQYYGSGRQTKRFLILEEKQYRFQAALSDISGCDINAYGDDIQLAPQKAVKHVRNWLVSEASVEPVGAKRVLGKYADFQEWYWEKKREQGASEDEITEYPTSELLSEMFIWMESGQPV
ncbi:hypothetical protein SAMN05444149_103771 [Pseudosulfitobacter pseudonitzschiae]|uniref:hypothetical protein n=1 Tax=Pseudosulfitobacter pseudonitzschiae TaxID=1402135 RepID=UPI000913921F|nr:hypothetical protein [Pseudosulfitobacter pseudonitzschiae]QKS08175.1 hypothetical protein HT745_06575 [Pseudosulfitobacter pseudonitzschiae]SHF37598.1 hypothetical protein SAMN05444149_103771 [Pseudosulfitobacter pseudonitzschiae]